MKLVPRRNEREVAGSNTKVTSILTSDLCHDSRERVYLLYYTQMESSPRGVGDWHPLHVRQAMSRGSVVPIYG